MSKKQRKLQQKVASNHERKKRAENELLKQAVEDLANGVAHSPFVNADIVPMQAMERMQIVYHSVQNEDGTIYNVPLMTTPDGNVPISRELVENAGFSIHSFITAAYKDAKAKRKNTDWTKEGF